MPASPVVDPALDPAVDPRSLTAAHWRALLQPIEYAILRESATERPDTGRYVDDPGPGAFHCAGCAQRGLRGQENDAQDCSERKTTAEQRHRSCGGEALITHNRVDQA